MTRAPSAILVVRHGARLDAADANWHLTSPAPYDPPLTYGGWNQAKALGVRIANILSTRTAQQNAKLECALGTSNGATDGEARQRAKKQKVVIHTSPFLRCLQTSVAIAAGMAQSLELPEKKGKSKGKRRAGDVEELGDHAEEDGSENYSVKAVGLSTPDNVNIKTMLRVDAFLGEWLSPDYFERMTPPPSSTMMVAAAKATLLRKEQIEVFQASNPRPGYFPGGWSKANMSREAPVMAVEDDDISVDKLSLMVPIHKQRSNSAHSFGDKTAPIFSQLRPTKAAYDPPIPAYAVKPSDHIPRGYCGHARDACIDLDLLWDSMRFPQDWGDGGELGEEWSAMHKRFRRGLTKMIEWYTKHTPEFHPDREDPLALDHETDQEEDDDEDDYELTVILVTHAAGCNALVGALTNQPVLHDFGLTSLSMAIRNEPEPATPHAKTPSPVNSYSSSPTHDRRRPSLYSATSDDYTMHIVSSTNHLRAGARAAQASALTSPHLVPQIPAYESLSHTPNGSEPDLKRGATSTALGSIRRPSLAPSNTTMTPFAPASPSAVSSSVSTGLWSRASTLSSTDMPSLSIGAPAHSPIATALNAFSFDAIVNAPSSPTSPTGSEKAAKLEDDEVPPLPSAGLSRASSQRGGLWNAGARAARPKRRWTVTEHDQNE